MRDKLGRFVKGHHASKKTEFRKGDRREKNLNWKGGRRKTANGYIMVNVLNHPRAYRNGAYRNEVYEHIIVAEKKLGRYLKKGECVHHLNRIKDDNRPENIIIFPNNGKHMTTHTLNTWSRKYNKCRKCNSTEKKHEGRGLCKKCYKEVKYYGNIDDFSS